MAILAGWRPAMEVKKPSGLAELVQHGLLAPKTILEQNMDEFLDLMEKTPIPMKSNKDGDMLKMMLGIMLVQMMSSLNPLVYFRNLSFRNQFIPLRFAKYPHVWNTIPFHINHIQHFLPFLELLLLFLLIIELYLKAFFDHFHYV